ncbi:diol dehydratase reactivase subunit alpha [Thermanaerosceptrum fracticalcis]|uniref:Diol dehydratase reactivase subunit alpha n=1 Tax=Thermanaerosceptrum fracticalcis TaxID=1712410 RepID=A0A7G6E7F0_THEFR|nr:diol dehydratase reactivase subunit alpha [Thermanaerosceptrum fracticalcis]QNB48004.1 diol dehydratase reactivase subunit alpha [Thermanaerosceptrum fracticalcis]
MTVIAGVDIGNSTTEVCLASIDPGGQVNYLASSTVKTTGIKGTLDNLPGVVMAIQEALEKAGIQARDLSLIRLNEATPVIGDVAMETITETIITESTMIGHNPATPGGIGLGTGITTLIKHLPAKNKGEEVICVIPAEVDYEEAAALINEATARGIQVRGAVAQNDDAVLIVNRLKGKIPVVDEVSQIERVPLGMPAAVEVAEPGQAVQTLANPYGIATVFKLSPEETKMVVPIARALMGNRSAVVIRTPRGDVKERKIPAGSLIIQGTKHKETVDIEEGSEAIMATVKKLAPLADVYGEPGTNVGGMLEKVRSVMSSLTGQDRSEMKIQDILAVDTIVPQKVRGGVAGEFAMESAIGLAAMVKTNRLPMEQIAAQLTRELGVKTVIAGVEANMALQGALTTPGTAKPLAILDLGGGSSDGALITRDGQVHAVHLAGAGDMVTMLINSELGLEDLNLAEEIKKYSLGKVESLFHLRLEDGTVRFFEKSLPPQLFARVVIIRNGEDMVPIPAQHSLEKIRNVRREAKKKVFVTNALRALQEITPTGNIRHLEYVVLVGGSALDFEIPGMISDALAEYGIVCGQGNIRGTEGPRNAVATGLVLSFLDGKG